MSSSTLVVAESPQQSPTRAQRSAYTAMMPEERMPSVEEYSKARLARVTDRSLRRVATLKFWGADGMLYWWFKVSWPTFLFYGMLCSSIYCLNQYGISFARDILQQPMTYRPFLMGTLQFLAAFLVGVGLTDAVTRYKSAMGALTDLSDSIENLRMILLSSTVDPKFRIAVQVHISWMIVLLRKKIAFFTEDFEQEIGSLIPNEFMESALFRPEVLWALDRAQAEFLFMQFLQNAKLIDKEGMVKKGCDEMIKSWKTISSLLMVRSPTTRHVLGRTCVQLFLFAIPIFNEDIITLVSLPLVASVLTALLQLATELAEPWGEEFHDLPVNEVMYYLSVPQWFGNDQRSVVEALAWLNKGMTDNNWKWDGESPIPRTKRRGSGKGETIDFEDYRTLQQITGYHTFGDFLMDKGRDMADAEARGRRMPKYLRWNKTSTHGTSFVF